MKKCKKILAIILSAILLLAVVPTSVFAQGVTIVDISIPDLEVIENYGDDNSLTTLKQVFASGEALTVNQVKRFNKFINSKYSTKFIRF